MDQDAIGCILRQGSLDEDIGFRELWQEILLTVIPNFVVDQVLDIWMLWSGNISHPKDMSNLILRACFEGCCSMMT